MHHITILGSGTSTGVPVPCCSCDVCNSSDPRNQRLRSSALISTAGNKNILIDTSTDLRQQVLTNSIKRIDSCIITHEHADHTHGIDDLRPFCFGPPKKEICIWTYNHCAKILEAKYPYIFQRERLFNKDRPIIGGGVPMLSLMPFEADEEIEIENEIFYFHKMPHGYGKTLGIIHSKMAYITDCHEIPDIFLQKLIDAKLDVLVLDCINKRTHKTHLSFSEAKKYLSKIKAKKTILTHLNHDFDHKPFSLELEQEFGNTVELAFDGLTIGYH